MSTRNRLSREEVARTLSKGRRLHGDFVVCIVKVGDKPGFTVVVPKSVSPLATGRARIKRRIREAVRSLAVPAGSLAIMAKKNIVSIPFAQIRVDLAKVFDKLELA